MIFNSCVASWEINEKKKANQGRGAVVVVFNLRLTYSHFSWPCCVITWHRKLHFAMTWKQLIEQNVYEWLILIMSRSIRIPGSTLSPSPMNITEHPFSASLWTCIDILWLCSEWREQMDKTDRGSWRACGCRKSGLEAAMTEHHARPFLPPSPKGSSIQILNQRIRM